MEEPLRENETVTTVNENIRLIQQNGMLRFGTDALLLAAMIRPLTSGYAVEFGAGSGIISFLCAARKKLPKIYAVEVQDEYAELCARNTALNGFSDVVFPVHEDIRTFVPEEGLGTASVVFSNPPYMTGDSGYSNADAGKFAARHEVNGDIGDFCAAASRLLRWGGTFYCVYRPDRLVDLICAMRNTGIEPKKLISVHADSRHEPCMVLIEGKKGAKPSLQTTKPLLLYEDGTTKMTHALEYIYENGEFEND